MTPSVPDRLAPLPTRPAEYPHFAAVIGLQRNYIKKSKPSQCSTGKNPRADRLTLAARAPANPHGYWIIPKSNGTNPIIELEVESLLWNTKLSRMSGVGKRFIFRWSPLSMKRSGVVASVIAAVAIAISWAMPFSGGSMSLLMLGCAFTGSCLPIHKQYPALLKSIPLNAIGSAGEHE
jgi:hypothetical protein